jgi:hypothetical protein
MNKQLNKAAWETVRQLKRARRLGHSACYRTLAKGPFQEVARKLKQARPANGELLCEYQGWLYDLKRLKDFLAIKMYLKNRILVQAGRRFSNLDLALALLDLLAEKDCSLIARAITGSETIFSSIILPLENAADWSPEDERQLTDGVKWQERKRLFAEVGGAALFLGVGYYLFKIKKKKEKRGAK